MDVSMCFYQIPGVQFIHQMTESLLYVIVSRLLPRVLPFTRYAQ